MGCKGLSGMYGSWVLDSLTTRTTPGSSLRTPGVGDGQGGLVCCSSWGRKESDTTEQLK